jgi:hypothetical protein
MSGFSGVQHNRLRGSFIYLANAVGDLRTEWQVLAAVLAPLAFLTALCLLPDSITLQHALAEQFVPGARHVGYGLTQGPYQPLAEVAGPLIPWWAVLALDLAALLLVLAGHLLVLCSLRRRQTRRREPTLSSEAVATWREALELTPAYFWIAFLQLIIPSIALALWRIDVYVSSGWAALLIDVLEFGFLILAGLLFLWLFFSAYALVFDNKHSFHALLASRDLMRKRFFRVAMRIVVFSAVWSGYESWAAAVFAIVSRVVGPVGFLTGYFWTCFFAIELAAVAVTYVLGAFFVLAQARLYQDLSESIAVATENRLADVIAAAPGA